MTRLYFRKLKKLCKYNYSLQINDYFVPFLRPNFDQKYEQKLCIFALFWGKYNYSPKRKSS